MRTLILFQFKWLVMPNILLVFNQKREQVRHRRSPHLAQGVVVEALVEPHHVLDMRLGDEFEARVAVGRQRRWVSDRGYTFD